MPLILAAGVAMPAVGDEPPLPAESETVRYECSDCHMACQWQLLPQRTWRRLTEGLADYFGKEPSVHEGTTQEVWRYLFENPAALRVAT